LIDLSIDSNIDIQELKNINDDWPNIDHLIFDETSMIGCTMLVIMYFKMQNLKSKSQQSFANINIMFLRDFIQFLGVTDILLYTPNIKCNFSYTKKSLK
jgi:hypothetical protein